MPYMKGNPQRANGKKNDDMDITRGRANAKNGRGGGAMKASKVARFGLLTAVALILGWLEHMIPIAAAMPGIKLGLANTVLLYAIYLMDAKSAALLMVMKVLLSGFLFAGLSAMLFSFAGGLVSLLVMLLVKKVPGIGTVGVSVSGAVAHNMAQIATASLVVNSLALVGYLPILLIAAVITGILTGVVAKYALPGMRVAQGGQPKKNSEDRP